MDNVERLKVSIVACSSDFNATEGKSDASYTIRALTPPDLEFRHVPSVISLPAKAHFCLLHNVTPIEQRIELLGSFVLRYATVRMVQFLASATPFQGPDLRLVASTPYSLD